jgi:hypothetical protein
VYTQFAQRYFLVCVGVLSLQVAISILSHVVRHTMAFVQGREEGFRVCMDGSPFLPFLTALREIE